MSQTGNTARVGLRGPCCFSAAGAAARPCGRRLNHPQRTWNGFASQGILGIYGVHEPSRATGGRGMRVTLLAAVALVALSAASSATPTAASTCRNQATALGVSRVVEIDTSGGPRLGHVQHKDLDLLRDGEVALTFDDGPLRPYTRPVLDALAVHCTKATFFVVGRMAVADPAMVQEIARRGHTIGTHTWSHRNLPTLLPHRAKEEIELGFSAVQKAAGAPIAPFFRFPYLSESKGMIAHLQQRQMGIFSIDVDSNDYRTQDARTVHRTIIKQLMEKRKGIILFHDIQPSTARALKPLLDDLKARGFRVVHFVPKLPATTLPATDAIVEKELARVRIAAASSPMATRSLLWSRSPGRTGSAPARHGSALSPAPAGTPAAPTQQSRPLPVGAREEGWLERVFGDLTRW
jgi:peptidoglycan/xylan/chitin deacetylase (PgdA/CDA1 family)